MAYLFISNTIPSFVKLEAFFVRFYLVNQKLTGFIYRPINLTVPIVLRFHISKLLEENLPASIPAYPLSRP